MTADDIAADRAVIDAATRCAPGPWAALGTRLLEDTGGCTCGPGGLNGLHEPYCGAEPVAEGSPDVIAFAVAARTGWPRALDALEAAWGEAEQWKRMADRREEALDALGAERNTWARQMADLHDEHDDAARAKVDAEARMREALDDRDDALNRAEQAEVEVARLREREARVLAMCDAHEYGARDWDIAVVPTSALRAALDGEA